MTLGPFAIPIGRPERENELFWQSLESSVLDCIITDHAPHTKHEKDAGWADMWAPPPGLPGLETLLGIMLTRVDRGLMDLCAVARIASRQPAKIAGIDYCKGALEQGKDADLVIIDTQEKWIVQNERLYTKCGWSPFSGKVLVGRPRMTILRGKVIMQDGKVVGLPGYGLMIKPRYLVA
jgi:dihydroorotase